MVADKGKKPKIGEKVAEEQIDSELVLSIEKLQEVQDELEKINEEASEKVLEVEQKYNVVRKPVYDKRSEVTKSIPDFWLTAFLSHPVLSDLLTEEDQRIFKHLTTLEVEDDKDVKSGYSITFNFSPNPYFENLKLTKTFTFIDEGTAKVTATPINWKEGKGILHGGCDHDHEKNGNKRCHEDVSFFTWFCGQKDDIDDIQDEVAEIIREDLWTNPLTYFNNDDDEEDEEGDEEENGTESEEGDEDEEDEEN